MSRRSHRALSNRPPQVDEERTPKWRSVQQLVLGSIDDGKLREGDHLPSDAELARRAGCSIQPVLRAMQDLAQRGIVLRRPGGTTVVLARRPLLDDSAFSFSLSARNSSSAVFDTIIVEQSRRRARAAQEAILEKNALRELGLRRTDEFIILVRVRRFDGVARVIHRSYLNPAHHESGFLSRHDFARESLIEIFNVEGFSIHSRDTVLTATMANAEEQSLLRVAPEPVLSVEQRLLATRTGHGEPVVVEYLAATYLGWKYKIQNRSSNQGARSW